MLTISSLYISCGHSSILTLVEGLLSIISIESHMVSAIINVAQLVDSPWPFDALDFKGKHRKISLKPGEMIFYESARYTDRHSNACLQIFQQITELKTALI